MEKLTIEEVAARFGVTPSDILSVLSAHREEFKEDQHYSENGIETRYTSEGCILIGMLLPGKGGSIFRKKIITLINLKDLDTI